MEKSYYTLQAKSHDKLLQSLLQMTKDYNEGIETKLPKISIYTVGSFVFTGHLLDASTAENTICLLGLSNDGERYASYIEINSIVNITIIDVEKSMARLSLSNEIRRDSIRPSNIELKKHLKYITLKISKHLDLGKDITLEADVKSFPSAIEALTLLGQAKELYVVSQVIKEDALMLEAFKEKVNKIEVINADESLMEIEGQTMKMHLSSKQGARAIVRINAIMKSLNNSL